MFFEAVPGALKRNLESLGEEDFVRQFWLAGGTAGALQLGHRISRDLGFFNASSFDAQTIRATLGSLGDFESDRIAEDTLLGNLNGVHISFFLYRYKLLYPPHKLLGVALADLRDLGCMKIDAVQHRGRKRDFIDLWAILQNGLSLQEMLYLFDKKFEGVRFNRTHILKSLSYFDDAEEDQMPEMLKPASWEEIKRFFAEEAKKLVWT